MPTFENTSGSVSDPDRFDSGDAETDERLTFRTAFAATLTQHGFPDTLVLSRERAGTVFHERRLEIVHYLQAHEPTSVRALSEALGYDKGVVSRDLQELAAMDVVEYEDRGRAKAPRLKHRHVVVEPIV